VGTELLTASHALVSWGKTHTIVLQYSDSCLSFKTRWLDVNCGSEVGKYCNKPRYSVQKE